MLWLTDTLHPIWLLYWPSLAVVCGFALLERIWPLEPYQPWRATWFNLLWHALFLALFFALSWTAWGRLINWLVQSGATPLLGRADSVSGEMARVALVILVHDFLVYWGHRLMHAVPALWAFHRLHHDEQHLNASTSLRQHWLVIPVHQLVVFMPLTWLFGLNATPEVMYYALIVLGGFHHANLKIPLGRFTPFFVGPQYHRIHHAPPRALHDCNFAGLFPVWDQLFGTCHLPARDAFGPTGLNRVTPTASQWHALIDPLHDWWRMVRPKSPRLLLDKE